MRKTSRVLLSLFILLIMATPVFANQINYQYSSKEVQSLLTLSRLTGTALSSMTYPVSSENLKSMLIRIDSSSLSGEALAIYRELWNSLESTKILFGNKEKEGFDIALPITLIQMWNNDSYFPYMERNPIISANVDLYLTEYFSAEVDFDFRAEENNYVDLKNGIKLHSPLSILKDIAHEFPTMAYGSIGNKKLNLTIGRSRLSAGNGVTGNLEISENLLYQDYAKFSVLSGPISYDFTILAYDSPDSETTAARFNFIDPYKTGYIHRFSTVFGKRVSVSLFEGIMTYSNNMLSDIRALNPFMLIHNTFTYENGNVNNFFGLEVDASLPYGLNLGLQGFIDQVKLGDETENSGEPAFAVLANLKGTWIAGKGILSAYAEYAHVSKYNYLKELNPPPEMSGSAPSEYYQIDLIAANKFFPVGVEQNYIGYPYGSDSKTFSLGASYLLDGREYMFDFRYRVKGEFGIGTHETRAIQKLENHVPDENTFSISVGSKGNIIKGIEYLVKAGYTKTTDYNHVSGATNPSPLWFAISFTINPMSFVK